MCWAVWRLLVSNSVSLSCKLTICACVCSVQYQDLSVLTPSFVDNLFKIERKVVDPTPKPLPPQATVKLPGTRGPKRKGETFPTASKRTRT